MVSCASESSVFLQASERERVSTGQSARRTSGQRSRARTALFDGAVVELGLGVGGVAPGSVLVPVRVAAVVLRQVGVWVGARVDPGTTTTQPELMVMTSSPQAAPRSLDTQSFNSGW